MIGIAGTALVAGEWSLASSIRADLKHIGVKEEKPVPYNIVISGEKLKTKVKEELSAVNASRMARVDKSLGEAIVLEGVTYERNGGVVHAKGKLRDLAEGRQVLAVMDAYDVDLNYLTSAAAPVRTAKGSPSSFSLAMPDREDLSTLSFRVLNEADRNELVSLNEDDLKKRRMAVEDRAIMLLDDMVLAGDLKEAEERLRHLGYISAPQDIAIGETALRVLFNRFRKDHGLPGTKIVDMETFLALRVVTPDFRPQHMAQL